MEHELRAYVASRVCTSLDTRRTLFDRAVVWLVKNRVRCPALFHNVFKNWTMPRLLPVRMLDAHLAKLLGLTKQ